MKEVYIKTIGLKEIGRIKLPKGVTVSRSAFNILHIKIASEIENYTIFYSILCKFKEIFDITHVNLDSILREIDFHVDNEQINQINCSKHENYNTWTFYTKEVKEIPVTNKLQGIAIIRDLFG